MSIVNDINKIYCNSPISVKHINMTSLLFVDKNVVSKSRYSVVDNYINLVDVAEKTICLYQHRGSSHYYEYHIDLKTANTITGKDIFGNTLSNISNTNNLVFVNGQKLAYSEYTVNDDGTSISLKYIYLNQEISTVIVYVSESLNYQGKVNDLDKDGNYIRNWDPETNSFDLDDYTYLRYMFFKNGEILTRNYIHKIRDRVTLNTEIRYDEETGDMIDTIEYYMLPIDTENVIFEATPGYFSYGPKDNLDLPVPETHDTEVTFQTIVRLAIDDVRKGFFIREENGDGCLMITGEDFETKVAYCTAIKNFSNEMYTNKEYFVQVPNARSILKYISEYDLNKMMMPEILGSFQKLLLDETYDSIQRLKNIRNINKVDSFEINKLIKFMGLDINITNMDLEKKHALLEELTNFYNIVGTRESYNFYNIMNDSGKIVQIEQLFTPIKDYSRGEYGPAKRYVDFRTAEELGAVTKTRYEYPFYDLGQVDVLANPEDSFTNQPRSEGLLNYVGYNVHGNPTIINDKLSNITNNDNVYLNQVFNPREKDFEVNVKIITPDNVVTNTSQYIFQSNRDDSKFGFIFYINASGHLAFNTPKQDMSGWYGGATSSILLKSNTLYYVRLKKVGRVVTLYHSENGRDYVIDGKKTLPDEYICPELEGTRVGISYESNSFKYIFNGTIYLTNETNIYIDDSLYWTPLPTNLPAIIFSPRYTYTTEVEDDNLILNVEISQDTLLNKYIEDPYPGPNEPQTDFGSVAEEATSFYDFGYVSDVIKGQWIEWTEWNRPRNWYPTNHVDVAIQIPPSIDYKTFMTEFKNTFYDIASAVLYIHSIIEVYVFGNENPTGVADSEEASGGGANFGIVTSPTYYTIEYAFTNDPARQDYRYD